MGISKGGFGSGVGILATPLMALTLPMSQAAAIMLPILCVMDLAGIYAYRGKWSRENMKLILWGGILGVVIGAFTFRFFDDALLRVGIGAFAIAFVIYRLSGDHTAPPAPRSVPKGLFWSTMGGFTSTLIHAGGPPLNVYLLPQRLEKVQFVATTVLFFTVINYVKLVPYAWLGLFDARNLTTSAVLIPLAPVGIFMGVWIMKRIPQESFYRLCYAMLLVVGGKLLYDGIRGWGV
ncbi:sulfite exporter TauE/SafE family protein [Usitatibacter palustris]|uniref:Probable membrane transporter protein n=1 Tax=Usitatibacter palustris TaxID=2732487 RepID=A0A6M4H8A6_9PROT|nr:hypothetical protein DSM104440_02647 [Usitatibacter palustris]